MTGTWTRRIVFSSALLLALAGAFVAGRLTSREPAARGEPAVERPPFTRKRTDVPAWAPTAGWVLPEVGSLFRDRFATADSPLDGVEAVLFTPRTEECQDDCPLSLRMVGGDAGANALMKIPITLSPDVRRLVEARGMPAAVGERLKRTQAELEQDAAVGRAEGGRPPTRALFIGMPRPDVAQGAWSVGMVLSDLTDPHFDPARPGDSPREGRCLFVTRVESLDARGKRTPTSWPSRSARCGGTTARSPTTWWASTSTPRGASTASPRT
jgi:hypothetical protein